MAPETSTRSKFYRAAIVSAAATFVMVYSMMLPVVYLPEMTLWLGYREQDKGYYAEYMSSSYSLGTFCTVYALSRLSDKVGHRIILLVLLFANGVLSVVLGLSQNLIMVIILRFLMGSCYAVVPISRAILSLCTDETTHVIGMAITTFSFLCGTNLASILGSYLTSPVTKYPYAFARCTFFEKFPYALPPLLTCFLSLIVTAVVFFMYVDPADTNCDTSQEDRAMEATTSKTHNISVKRMNYSSISEPPRDCETNLNIDNIRRIVQRQKVASHAQKINDPDKPYSSEIWPSLIKRLSQSTFAKLVLNKDVMKINISYTLLQVVTITYIDIFIIWASTVQSLAGLEYTTTETARVLTVFVLPCSVGILILTPLIERRIGVINMFMVFAMLGTIGITLTPMCRLILDKKTQCAVIILCLVVTNISEASCGIAGSILINNSVPPSQAGAANGLARMFGGIGRFIYQIAGGSIYAATVISTIGAPIDVSLIFVLLGVNMWLICIIVYFVPRQFNHEHEANQ